MGQIQTQRWCEDCQRNTLHLHPSFDFHWGCLLTILTSGLFILAWIPIKVIEALGGTWRCQQCGRGDTVPLPALAWVVGGTCLLVFGGILFYLGSLLVMLLGPLFGHRNDKGDARPDDPVPVAVVGDKPRTEPDSPSPGPPEPKSHFTPASKPEAVSEPQEEPPAPQSPLPGKFYHLDPGCRKVVGSSPRAMIPYALAQGYGPCPICTKSARSSDFVFLTSDPVEAADEEMPKVYTPSPADKALFREVMKAQRKREDSQRASIYLKAAQNLEKMGKVKGAVDGYRQVIKDFPDTKQADDAAARLKALGK